MVTLNCYLLQVAIATADSLLIALVLLFSNLRVGINLSLLNWETASEECSVYCGLSVLRFCTVAKLVI